LASVGANSNGNLVDASANVREATLGDLEERVDPRMDDPAMVDPQQTMRRTERETELAEATADAEARLVAVMPGLHHADRGPHELGAVTKASDPPELIGDDVRFQLQLEQVIRMLPGAPAAALDVIRARRKCPAHGGTLDAGDLGTGEIAALLLETHERGFTWQRAWHEDNPPVGQVADGLTAEGRACQLDADQFALLAVARS
jgi:hypothetical protein